MRLPTKALTSLVERKVLKHSIYLTELKLSGFSMLF